MRHDTILLSQAEVLKRYKIIDPRSHKGTLGHALLIGGSYGKIGSICLASKAALKTGCGLVTTFLPKCGYTVIQTYVPEVMAITGENDKHLSNLEYDFTPNAIGIGPGMGQEIETQQAFFKFLSEIKDPLVIDADALNILSLNPQWLALLQPGTILTPHPKELERLIGKFDPDEEIIAKTIELSIKFKIVIVMKGAPTRIVDGDNLYQNTTGNATLATAGSGDVLTGMITSLLAQGYESIDAAILAVYLHGLTADIAVPITGVQSFIASDIISTIGQAYLTLESAR